MHALWVSLKDNVRCNGNKVADVVGRASEICNRRNSSSGKANSGGGIVHGKETAARELMHRGSYTQAQLYELDIGDKEDTTPADPIQSVSPMKSADPITSALEAS